VILSMPLEILNIFSPLIQKKPVEEILSCNSMTVRYGLVLTERDAVDLLETGDRALKSNGRIEFGGGVIPKIIAEFCDSPYLTKDGWIETLRELTELFYYFKNETMDLISDDDLIAFMKEQFDGKCHGSPALLADALDSFARRMRDGTDPDRPEDEMGVDDDGY